MNITAFIRKKKKLTIGGTVLLIVTLLTLTCCSHKAGTPNRLDQKEATPPENSTVAANQPRADTEQGTSEIQLSLNLLAKANFDLRHRTAVQLAQSFVGLQIGIEKESQKELDDAVNGERGDPALGNRQAAEANLAGQTIDGHYISGGEAAAMVDGMTASFIKVPGAWRKVDEPLALALKDCETVLGYYLIPHWDGSHFEDNIQASEGDGSPYYDYMIYHSRLAQ